MGGPQTCAFIMCPVNFPVPAEPIIGAASAHGLLAGWRRMLQGEGDGAPRPQSFAPVEPVGTTDSPS
jgi:hypothetical protein